ncbi:MAG: hypothetical protein IKF22_03530 [Lachnospiraceae bacterium]|nr:hypothetical protein [Lachnospiraceae bacterium]
MTDTELKRQEAICEVAGVDDIGELSDGFHTFNSLYEQRMILFAALVKAYKDRAWKSYRHEDGEYCFGGGWFIVGIDTPEGGYTYHYENKYWDMFDCIDLPRGKHWDGHTDDDADTRLMSLEPEQRWIPWSSGKFPEESGTYTVTAYDGATKRVTYAKYQKRLKRWELTGARAYWRVLAWRPLPEPYKAERREE